MHYIHKPTCQLDSCDTCLISLCNIDIFCFRYSLIWFVKSTAEPPTTQWRRTRRSAWYSRLWRRTLERDWPDIASRAATAQQYLSPSDSLFWGVWCQILTWASHMMLLATDRDQISKSWLLQQLNRQTYRGIQTCQFRVWTLNFRVWYPMLVNFFIEYYSRVNFNIVVSFLFTQKWCCETKSNMYLGHISDKELPSFLKFRSEVTMQVGDLKTQCRKAILKILDLEPTCNPIFCGTP